ncbi:GNAT family N-acetyltransferase [Rhizomonospora bruguierae]|uniref:GNAT family N-acetyltransferase n=1 Tax=Rhizomonospora bruguierae TaxID=1581705 RepID=UPI001BCD812D|nr:GNAT family N-acetyltransferase [Micromonospora sp. NBRC 107566]
MVREWDPLTAPDEEIESLLGTLNAALAADLPEDPPWRNAYLREYLGETMQGERRICWVAQEGTPASPGKLKAQASVLLLGDIGVLDLLVHPDYRRAGVGRSLIGEAARRAYREGFTSVGVEVIGDTPAVPFYESIGFACAYRESRSVLPLSSVDWLALGEMSRGIGAGYRIEYYPGGPPEELIASYARAKAEVRDVEDDPGDLDLRPSSYDPERLRDSIATLHRRGMKPYIVLAIHEKTGEVAGLTEVVVPAQHPSRADQYDTIVVPDHRGYGIDRAIKARMLFELRSAEPQLTEVQTWNALDNAPMLKVNAELGFLPDREWREYDADVADVVARLGAPA